VGGLQKGGVNSRPAHVASIPIDELIARGFAIEREQLVREREKWLCQYAKLIGDLRTVSRRLEGRPSLANLVAGSDMVDWVSTKLTRDGVPLAQVAGPLVKLSNQRK
jgi:hypothetical protein